MEFQRLSSISLAGRFLVSCLLVLLSGTTVADEPVAEFLEGLRQRKYFDTALEHLEELSKRSDIPPELSDSLDLEKGITYRAMGAASRIPEDREQALGQAEAALKRFVSTHAKHPRAAYANAELGQLLFDRARSFIWDSESPSNAARKRELQDQARALIEQAKGIYQTANDQYKAQYKAYPKYIDKAKEEVAYKERLSAEVKYLRARFNLVRCTYERGQTFDKGSKERNETLIRASTEFESIHTEYRTTPIGLQSRLMMGKCFQEQDDINRAIGIYNEMLGHESSHPSVLLLKSIALQYRLICLNHEKRNDFQLVIQESDAWLKDKLNKRRLYTETGLGILWEKAIAEENLAKDRTLETKQKTIIVRQALADSKKVAKFPGPYREPALAMGRRLNVLLGEKDAEPKDFDTAFERARGMVGQLKGLNEDLRAAKSTTDKDKAQQAIELQLNEIGRLLELALHLQDEKTDKKALAQSRYLLSYVFMRQRKSFDAYILAKHCMTRDRENDPDSALSATEIAIEAAVQASNDAGLDQDFELSLLKEICELIIAQYPQSSKGNEARIRLGQVYRDINQPLKAAETYLSVPKDYSLYASSRIQAGQSFWLAWLSAMKAIEAGKEPEHDSEALSQWKTRAESLLVEGLDSMRAGLGKDGKPTTEMAAAEVSLATILNMNGKFDQSIARLTAGGVNSVARLVEVKEGATRPEKGIQSSSFAGQLYRLLLRAYVGTQKIDDALKTMSLLEAAGGQDTAAVYTELGRELQEELRQKKASGDSAGLEKTRKSFEDFLTKVYDQRDKSDYSSLLWIGETYYGLGQGVKEDVVAAGAYYKKANQAFQEIIDSKLAEGTTILAIKLRQVRCQRAQGRYEEAVQLAKEVLSQNEMSLDIQFEAAYALADWGASGKGPADKLLASIQGVEDAQGKKTLWGWHGITRRLTARQSLPDWDTMKDRFLEARFEYVNSRYRYAQTEAADGKAQLELAKGEIAGFALAFSDLDDTWFAKFDELYQNIQAELGEDPKPLERPVKFELSPEDLVSTDPEEIKAEKAEAEQAVAVAPPPEGSNVILVSLALILAAGGGFGFYKLMSKPPQRRRPAIGPGEGSFVPPAGGGGDVDVSDGPPDFSGLSSRTSGSAAAVAAPPKKKRAAATKAAPKSAPKSGQKPAKKKRVLTPEEAAKYKAAKLAKAKAAAAGGKSAVPGTASADGTPKRKKVVKRVKKDGSPVVEGSGTPKVARKKKIVKKRPPAPPES